MTAPLPAAVEVAGGLVLTVAADRDRGLVVVALAAWPWARMVLAPEAAAELSLRLIDKANDVRHAERRS
jgi:hypothetical protein